jgi:hypothetical protein
MPGMWRFSGTRRRDIFESRYEVGDISGFGARRNA